MRIQFNAELCDGHGQCVGAAPEIFAFDDQGHLQVLVETVPEELMEAAEDAVDLCPVQALGLVE